MLSINVHTSSIQEYTFEEMNLDHTRWVSRLHADYMPNSLLSELGADVLDALYACLLETHYGVGYVLLKEDRVVGFSFGRITRTRSLLTAVLSSWRRFVLPFCKLLVTRPGALAKVLVRLIQSDAGVCEPGVGELSAIVVAREVRGNYASQQTAELLFDRLRKEGCRRVFWETLADNVRAQKFYAKMGGRVIEEKRIAGHRILWYEKDLGV